MTSPAAQRTFMKDLQQLYKTIDASTDGQASIVGIDEMTVKVSLRPKAGYNAHAEFLVTIECCTTYPRTSPKVSFDTPILHPNIDLSSGSVCLSILNEWRSCYNLLDLVKALLYLIDHPTFHLPLYPMGVPEDSAQLARNSVRLLAGLPVNGFRFPPNPVWVEWARVSGCLPSEEEEALEETDVGGCINEEVEQEGGEIIGEFTNTAAPGDEKPIIAASYAPSDTTSNTIPSFAKIRHLFDPDEDDISWGPYATSLSVFEVKSQRILIWPPNNGSKSDNFTTFFFIEFLGTDHHRHDLGDKYSTLFIGNVLHECQSYPESRQTSSDCPWYAFVRYPEYSYHSYTFYGSSMNLSNIFEDKETPMHDRTADFCPWSTVDGKGINALFGGLFFEDSRSRGNFTCFLDRDSDVDSGSQGIGRLFDSCLSDHEEVFESRDELSETVARYWFSNHEDDNFVEGEVPLTEEQENYANETDDERENVLSSVSSTTYKEVDVLRGPITECLYCTLDCSFLDEPIDAGLAPLWRWIFRQTRWPFRFAPQQNVDLSMTGIRIPPWRASSGRMMSDVCHFCSKNQDVSSLVLLDPMALSPLSPLLNLMRHSATQRPQLTGVLWMTPLDALSPSYHVPVPLNEQQKDSDDEGHEGGDGVYPTPICLRFLTITAFLTNWVAWLSRVESYAVLGMSRFRPLLISAPVAAHFLQPFSLGCGQAPLLDLWPMWLLRRLLTASLRLSQLHVPLFHCNRQHQRYLFPFSDLDEI